MTYLAVLFGLLVLLFVLWDTFETMVMPRTVWQGMRLTRLYYKNAWRIWSGVGKRISSTREREKFLAIFGPLSLLLLIGIWAIWLIVGFAMIQWGVESNGTSPEFHRSFGINLYMSGVTFFTLGFGDVTPHTGFGRMLSVVEAGIGFGLLAVVISYLPVIYQSFSRREVRILLLDVRAGSPPTSGELLRRYCLALNIEELVLLLQEWEIWSAELLESYQSYPILAFYRSQRDCQSWVVALTVILDTCALIIGLGFEGNPAWQKPLQWQAKFTFTTAHRVIVALATSISIAPLPPIENRLFLDQWVELCACLASLGTPLNSDEASVAELSKLRCQYEPYVNSVAQRLLVSLPPWFKVSTRSIP
jgi:hypothetical protein